MRGQGDIFGGPVVLRHGARETEAQAALAAAGRAGTMRRRVYEAIKASPAGLTDEQIGEKLTGMPHHSTTRARRIELVDRGLVRATHLTRLTLQGQPATVWALSGPVVAAPCPHGVERAKCHRCARRERLRGL